MSNLKIPKNHQVVMPYIIVTGASEFLKFMKEVFGAEEKFKAERDASGIMHAEVQIGDSTIMFADSTREWEVCNTGLFIYVEDADKTYKKALEYGASSVMAIEDKEYGRSGGIKDPFGNIWWITSINK